MEVIKDEIPKIRMFYPGLVVLTVTSFFLFWKIVFNEIVLEFSKTLNLFESQLITLSGQVMCVLFMFFILMPRLELKPFFENYDDLAGKNPAIWRLKIIMGSYLIAFTILTSLYTFMQIISEGTVSQGSTGYLDYLLEFKDQQPPIGSSPILSIGILLIVYCIVAPAFEELLFRRILIPLLSEKHPRNAAPVLISAIIFASMRTVTQAGVLPVEYITAVFIESFIAGLMFGYVFTVTRRLSAAIISHGMWNLFDSLVIAASYSDDTVATVLPTLQTASYAVMVLTTAILLFLLTKKTNYAELGRAALSLFSFTAITNILLALIISLFIFIQNVFLFFLVTSVGLNIILFFYGISPPDELKRPEARGFRAIIRSRARGMFQSSSKTKKTKKKRVKAVKSTNESLALGAVTEMTKGGEGPSVERKKAKNVLPPASKPMMTEEMKKKEKKRFDEEEEDPLGWY